MAYKNIFTNTGVSTNLPVTVSGVSAGDIIVLIHAIDVVSAPTLTWPSGFTQQFTSETTADGQFLAVATKKADGTEGTLTTSSTASNANSSAAVIFSGEDSTTWVDVVGTESKQDTGQSSPITVTANSITLSQTCDLIYIATSDVTTSGIYTSSAPPSGMTERADFGDSAWTNLTVATLDGASSGSTGTKSSTTTLSSGTAGWTAVMLALRNVSGPTTYTRTLSDSVGLYDAIVSTVLLAGGPAAPSVTPRPDFRNRRTGYATGSRLRAATTPWSLRGTAADPSAGSTIYSRTISESVAVTENPQRVTKSTRLIPEVISLLDSLMRSQVMGRLVQDSAAVSESMSDSVIRTRSLADRTGVTDTAQRFVQAYRLISENAAVQDSILRFVNAMRSVADSLSVSDSVSRSVMQVYLRSLADSVSVTDALAAYATRNRVLADQANATDDLKRYANLFRLLADNVTAVDTLSRTISSAASIIQRVLTDSIDANDVTVRFLKMNRTASDALVLNDAIVEQFKLTRYTADNLSVADTVMRSKVFTRAIAEALVVTEATARFVLANRIVTDPVSATDFAMRNVFMRRLIAELIEANDVTGALLTVPAQVVNFILMLLSTPDPKVTTSDALAVLLQMRQPYNILMRTVDHDS